MGCITKRRWIHSSTHFTPTVLAQHRQVESVEIFSMSTKYGMLQMLYFWHNCKNSDSCYNFSFSRCNFRSHVPTRHTDVYRSATFSLLDLTHNLCGHVTSYAYAPYAYFGILTASYTYACTRNSFRHPHMVLDSCRSISRLAPTHPLHVLRLIATRPSTHSSRRAYSYMNACTHLS